MWWAAELATKLAPAMTVNAVSPGNTPGTDGWTRCAAPDEARRAPTVKLQPGVSHSVSADADRYVEAAQLRSP
ncbi:MAG: hypothetical protein AAFZ07_26855, partial [Actinomycetota bacterium]